jgi:glutathione S-transferase
MIFYDCSTAPSPRRARIWLAEKNAPHETVNIDLAKGEQLGDEFRAINPACTVPALKLDDGTVITQNAGISAYLEAAYPEPPLLGRNEVEKGQVADWTAKIEMEGLLAVAEALRNSSPYMKDRALTGKTNYAQIPELAERGLARITDFFDRLNTHLEGLDYIVTGTFTNADIVAAVTVDFARVVRVKAQPHHEHLLRWREGLNKRPSMQL